MAADRTRVVLQVNRQKGISRAAHRGGICLAGIFYLPQTVAGSLSA
jgi:hypothetical protein